MSYRKRGITIKQQYCRFHKTAHKIRVETKNVLCRSMESHTEEWTWINRFSTFDSIQQMMTNYSGFTTTAATVAVVCSSKNIGCIMLKP